MTGSGHQHADVIAFFGFDPTDIVTDNSPADERNIIPEKATSAVSLDVWEAGRSAIVVAVLSRQTDQVRQLIDDGVSLGEKGVGKDGRLRGLLGLAMENFEEGVANLIASSSSGDELVADFLALTRLAGRSDNSGSAFRWLNRFWEARDRWPSATTRSAVNNFARGVEDQMRLVVLDNRPTGVELLDLAESCVTQRTNHMRDSNGRPSQLAFLLITLALRAGDLERVARLALQPGVFEAYASGLDQSGLRAMDGTHLVNLGRFLVSADGQTNSALDRLVTAVLETFSGDNLPPVGQSRSKHFSTALPAFTNSDGDAGVLWADDFGQHTDGWERSDPPSAVPFVGLLFLFGQVQNELLQNQMASSILARLATDPSDGGVFLRQMLSKMPHDQMGRLLKDNTPAFNRFRGPGNAGVLHYVAATGGTINALSEKAVDFLDPAVLTEPNSLGWSALGFLTPETRARVEKKLLQANTSQGAHKPKSAL